MVTPNAAAAVGALAKACAFAATVPLLPNGATPRTIRAVLALTLVPLLLINSHPNAVAGSELSTAIEDGAIGAAFGLSASAIAGAVIGAGNAIDGALGSAAFIQRTSGGGPISRLYQLAFAFVFLESGGVEAMIARLAIDDRGFSNHGFSWHGLEALGRSSIGASFALAGPSLFAQALATIVAGVFARVAPQINGVLFSAPLGSWSVLLALAAGAASLWPALADIVRQALVVPRSLLH